MTFPDIVSIVGAARPPWVSSAFSLLFKTYAAPANLFHLIFVYRGRKRSNYGRQEPKKLRRGPGQTGAPEEIRRRWNQCRRATATESMSPKHAMRWTSSRCRRPLRKQYIVTLEQRKNGSKCPFFGHFRHNSFIQNFQPKTNPLRKALRHMLTESLFLCQEQTNVWNISNPR